MSYFLISYDLRKQRNYNPLYRQLELWSAKRLLESLWVVNLNSTAGDLIDALRTVSDGDDGLTVIQLDQGINWGTYNVEPEGIELLKQISP